MAGLSEGELGELLVAARDAIVAVDAGGGIVLANPQAERLFGYAHLELIGQAVELLVPAATHTDLWNGDGSDPLPRPLGARVELAGRRRDNSEFPIEISRSAVDTDDGVVVIAVIRDITEHQKAARVLAQLASIVQSSHDAIVGKTPEGIVESWNAAAERLYGYTSAEAVGRHTSFLLPAHRVAEEAAMLERVARGEPVELFEAERIRKDGSTVAVSLTVSTMTDASGAVVGVASIARDVTERRRAEAKFRGLLEAAPDAMVCVDHDGLIVLVNTAAERLFGYDRDGLIGQPVELLVPERARARHPAHRVAYFADTRPRPMGAGAQLAARRRDGTEFPAEISLSALETDEGTLVSAAIRDVTDRIEAEAERERLRAEAELRRLEHQLHQSQRLESLGQLAGGVAHDFNNLLGAIVNYAEFVGEELAAAAAGDADRDWPAVLRDVGEIQLAAERATALTHQLLAFARREVAQPQVLDLNQAVTALDPVLRLTLGEQVELKVSLTAEVANVKADAGQIEQILVNLAVNAREAMPGGGTLTIDTASVTVDEVYVGAHPDVELGRYVRLRVSDTGVGMPSEVLDRAFEPFFTTKPNGEGAGLGLATVYGIVTQAGGYGRIDSQPGIGTTFAALFPATTEALPDPRPEAPRPTSTGGETVLLVEDERPMRDVATRLLVRNGYDVISAASGPEALELAAAHAGPIHLLLTDVVMPKMLGNEVAERLVAHRPSTSVLFMSGYAQPVLGAKGTLEPGVSLIEKPFSEAALLAKVRAVLDGDG